MARAIAGTWFSPGLREVVAVYTPPREPVRDRPRHFETWDAAMWFAEFCAAHKNRKYAVRQETGLRGLVVWAVRPAVAR